METTERRMDFAVLVKVVPDPSEVRYDPERRTMVREGVELFLNPFDARALRVALDLRKPGERVTVLSMGPPSAVGPLSEALALGADRVVLLADRRLAGSDTLVTARVLDRALRKVPHDLVLGGIWSTDAETGQVGPEVAALLGLPVVSMVRKLQRKENGSFDALVDTETGWASCEFSAPVVVTVTEKIARIRGPTSVELERAKERKVETWSLEETGLPESEVGLAGSPTVVASLERVEPTRHARVFDEGTPEEKVGRAVEELRRLVAAPTAPELPRSAVAEETPSRGEIFVVVSGVNGRLDSGALATIGGIRESLPGYHPVAVWVGPPPTEDERSNIARVGAVRAVHFETPATPVGSRTAARALTDLLSRRPTPAAVIFGADRFGREVGGLVAGSLRLGLTGDAVGIGADASDLRWQKPAFGGGVVAEIVSRTRPSLATVRAGSFGPPRRGIQTSTEWVRHPSSLPPDPIRWREGGEEIRGEFGDLSTARVVVVAGMGFGSPANLPALNPLLQKWRAALAATRRVVDAGWLPRQLQVGLTGKSLAPTLAVLLGVSGSPNHLVGWRRAKLLLAVNSDPRAPAFSHVDVGIVGRWEELLGPLADGMMAFVQELNLDRAKGSALGKPSSPLGSGHAGQ